MSETSFSHLVVVGSSAGGIGALSKLVASLPENFPAPVVIAQHLDPEHESNLEAILERRSTLPVRTVTEHAPLEAGVIYVVPANRHVNITDSELDLQIDSSGRPKPSIDRLMSSASEVYGERLIAVVLTGTGSDGTQGARIVSQAGGTVIIQDPKTAEFGGMPGSLAPNTVDITTSLDNIGPVLGNLLSKLEEVAEETPGEDEKQALQHFLEELRERHGIDFNSYKMPTIRRRLKRRMAATNSIDLDEYRRYLDANPEEYRKLINTFLVKVTEFFRDPELFEYLKEKVLPELIEQAREENRQLRIWSAGCATGEEAYSLAILLSEALGNEAGLFNVRIFATDVDEEAVDFARRGVYPAVALSGLSEEQVNRYFIQEDGQYQVKKQVRGLIVFGEHDLARRSPFPRIDLVVSRNVLIYFTPELQRRALQLFAYSLRDDGYLMLGKAETTSPSAEFFEDVHRRYKVYRRRGARFSIPPTVSAGPASRRLGVGRSGQELRPPEAPSEPRRARAADEDFLNRLPVGIAVIDRRYNIRAINATARRLLSIRGAAIGEDLLHTMRGMPYEEVRHAIDGAFRDGESSEKEAFIIEEGVTGEPRHLCLICHPHRDENERGLAETVVVVIEDITETVRARGELEGRLENLTADIERFRRESEAEIARQEAQNGRLVETNHQLEEANRELNALNDDLRTAYEESLLSTEEAQASTEEVETLNEELQATNEELETLNEELQATIEELNATNDDLSARSMELQDLAKTREEERRRSEASRSRLEEILNQAPSAMMAVLRGPEHVFEFVTEGYAREMGRTRDDLLGETFQRAFPELAEQGLFERLDRAYETGEPFLVTESSLRLDHGDGLEETFVDVSLQPLRNSEGEVEGVMVYDVDRSEQVQLRQRAEELETVLRGMGDAVLAVNEKEEVLYTNDLFEETFGNGAQGTVGDLAPLDDNGQRLLPEAALPARAARGESFDVKFAVETEDGTRRHFEARGRPIGGKGGGVIIIRELVD